MEGIGSGAVTAPFTAADKADCIIVIGARPEQNHPVAATYLKNRAKQGAKLIVADPRGQGLGRHAAYNLQFKAGTDVALLNAMIHTIIDENLHDPDYLRSRADGFEELTERVKAFPPEKMAEVCGIDADTIREVARLYATSKNSIIFWGMGISQSVHGTDNARGLIALALVRCRAHSDVLPRLQVGGGRRKPAEVRDVLGHRAGPETRAYRRRDNECDPRRRYPRYVHPR